MGLSPKSQTVLTKWHTLTILAGLGSSRTFPLFTSRATPPLALHILGSWCKMVHLCSWWHWDQLSLFNSSASCRISSFHQGHIEPETGDWLQSLQCPAIYCWSYCQCSPLGISNCYSVSHGFSILFPSNRAWQWRLWQYLGGSSGVSSAQVCDYGCSCSGREG